MERSWLPVLARSRSDSNVFWNEYLLPITGDAPPPVSIHKEEARTLLGEEDTEDFDK
eukprot:CAMPEP_0194067362 /NCGR_PEP_ID=MMETSP0009_2-20130614/86516_1 /TAXON_ID=210454 /ORGANISM="Grammatophora oceanica, Strain CCMP 410" /LENGTH=56 /DNA_ID=CAMNT_0038720379 /DNA_START=779 /DNA_END=949 /DNA_ORIENTATION=-